MGKNPLEEAPMKELLGKLSALDPEASETLKVIAYFDTLIDGRVSLETLVRGAATLSGATVGYRSTRAVVRVLPDGRSGRSGDVGSHPSRSIGTDAMVWIERNGDAHANDAMVLERLAIAIAISRAHNPQSSSAQRAVEQLLDIPLAGAADHQKQLAAAARLRFDPLAKVRAIAVRTDTASPNTLPSAIIATPWGLVRGIIADADADVDPHLTRAGIGVAGTIAALPHSWRTALIALRLADTAEPAPRAEDLGSLLLLAELTDSQPAVLADVAAVEGLIDKSWPIGALEAIANGASLRTIATAAALHHSSVHAKLPELVRRLGYDPLTPLGRTRLYMALVLRRLARSRFD
jgi:hypothetical protein